MSRLRLALRLLGLVAVLAAIMPVHLVTRGGGAAGGRAPILFHRAFLWLFGVRVRERGTPPSPSEPTLILANHVSWLDIPVLGALRPLSFVAKSEIAGWPLVGTLARLQRSVFIDRARKTHTASVNTTVAKRLSAGDAIVLFAEGTTGDGNRILPFRASLVGAARTALVEGGLESVRVQPLAVAYTQRRGMPLTRAERPDIAWIGDMELAPHVAHVLARGPIDVEVIWGEPIRFDAASDRKAATTKAEAIVRRLAQVAKSGREGDMQAAPGDASASAGRTAILIGARTA